MNFLAEFFVYLYMACCVFSFLYCCSCCPSKSLGKENFSSLCGSCDTSLFEIFYQTCLANCRRASRSIWPFDVCLRRLCARTRHNSVFRSGCIVSCGCEVVGAFGGREDVDEAPDGGPKAHIPRP